MFLFDILFDVIQGKQTSLKMATFIQNTRFVVHQIDLLAAMISHG